MESIDTHAYLEFRDKLFPASGFQSAQMREIEIVMGLEDDERIGLGEAGRWRDALRTENGDPAPALARIERRLAERPTLRQGVDAWLQRTPIRGSRPGDAGDDAVVDGFVADWLATVKRGIESTLEARLDARLDAEAQAGVRARYAKEIEQAHVWLHPNDPQRRRIRAAILFIESYREEPLLAWPRTVLDRLVEAEQAMLIFRQRHARMVERVIGRRVGTGGSSGVDYLDRTAVAYRVFGDLWSARTFLLRKEDLPPLEEQSVYAFRME